MSHRFDLIVSDSYRPDCTQRRRWGGCGLVGGYNRHAMSCDPASLATSRRTQDLTQHTVRARIPSLCGTCRLYLSCPYGKGVALKILCPLMGSWESGQSSLGCSSTRTRPTSLCLTGTSERKRCKGRGPHLCATINDTPKFVK